jgi:hypothetical protein
MTVSNDLRLVVAGFLANHLSDPSCAAVARFLASDQSEALYSAPWDPACLRGDWGKPGGFILAFISGYKAVRYLTKAGAALYRNLDGSQADENRVVALFAIAMMSRSIRSNHLPLTTAITVMPSITFGEQVGISFYDKEGGEFSVERWILRQTFDYIDWCSRCA